MNCTMPTARANAAKGKEKCDFCPFLRGFGFLSAARHGDIAKDGLLHPVGKILGPGFFDG